MLRRQEQICWPRLLQNVDKKTEINESRKEYEQTWDSTPGQQVRGIANMVLVPAWVTEEDEQAREDRTYWGYFWDTSVLDREKGRDTEACASNI